MYSGSGGKKSDKMVFPILIRMGNNFFLLSDHSKLPIGEPFVVWSTNSSPQELALAEKAYAAGFTAGEDHA
jgi:hypothetical protein